MSVADVAFGHRKIDAAIQLPASKSLSNRVLIIHALGHLESNIQNLSPSADTVRLKQIRSGTLPDMIQAGEGGTTSRFMLALLALQPGSHRLEVSGSMSTRPVGELVHALRTLGAGIEFAGKDGLFPVIVHGGRITGNHVVVSGETSSQFISALMMIGPCIPGGLHIEITGELVSQPYISMTMAVMKYFGAQVIWQDNSIRIAQGNYRNRDTVIEADWSAASYWYEIAALSDEATIRLIGLKPESLQGDHAISAMMEQFGVRTGFDEAGAVLVKQPEGKVTGYFSADFSGCPDLAPAVAATCGALGITADLHGLKNFRLKESDRASALQRELYQFGVKSDFCGGSKFKVYGGNPLRCAVRPVNTYGDHRMAMALAPLAIKTGFIGIANPGVVSKSYPTFFDDLQKAGFSVVTRVEE